MTQSPVTVSFDRKKDPTACVATDGSRYSMLGVAVVERNQRHYLAATDGRTLSMIAATIDPPTATVPKDPFPTGPFGVARKAFKFRPQAAVDLNGSVTARTEDGGAVSAQAYAMTFPDVNGVVPEPRSDDVVIGVDVDLLANIVKALGTSFLELRIRRKDSDSQPIQVSAIDLKAAQKRLPERDGSFAVIMPIGIEKSKAVQS